jgi:hypothetical protein
VPISQKDGSRKMTTDVIGAIRTVAPRHTAKWMSRKWGRAVVTCKQWLKNGVPEYLLQTVLADLDEELEGYERELIEARAALKRARHERTASSIGNAARSGLGEGAPLVHQEVARRRQGADHAQSVGTRGAR